jgi:hypothetical protein
VNCSFFLCLAAFRTRSNAWVAQARLCVRCVLCRSAFPLVLGLGSANPAAGRPALFIGFIATMPESDFSGSCISGFGFSPSRYGPSGHNDQGINAVRRIPRRGPVDIRVVEAHGVELVPHQTQPTIGHTANLHLVASLLHMTKPCEWNDTTPRQHSVFENPPNQPTACFTYRPDPVSVYKSTRPN